MNTDTTPRFTSIEAQRIAREIFGLADVTVTPLPSERDQNFALTAVDGGRHVLKFAKSDEDRAALEFQNAALKHLENRVASALSVPKVVPSVSGQDITVVTDAAGRAYFTRLVVWLEGELFAKAVPHSAQLLSSLGYALAEFDSVLADFRHPCMNRHLQWDLRHVDLALSHLERLSEEQRRIVEHFRPHWEALRWEDLRTSVIHGDANDYNILTRHGRVAALIDFGDMVYSATVCDLAIGAAYAMLDKPDPLAVAATITAAYHERYALIPAEIDALFPLIVARLCMSVCYSAYNSVVKKDDIYQTVSARPAWNLLAQLMEVPFEAARGALRGACGPGHQLLASRRRLFGGNVRLSYRAPLHIVRGEGQYLFDAEGRRYLDAYNNVPHVGHCHPRVVRAGQDQMAKLNTNTRYLHERVNAYAEHLTSQFPDTLRVCYFVNSGSEANELAIRLARTHTGARDLIVLEHAYHGNTTTLIDISPYKHNGPGGHGAPPWVHEAQLPDLYRGPYKRHDQRAGKKYAESVVRILEDLRMEGGRPAGFIAESWPSVGGQMDFPQGYLPAVYSAVRAAGGVCIADEVQTGYGRLGAHFWGYQAYGVEPDIVVLGKPIGNGHPLGAVVTTPEIAASFDNGMEFFSTFGGNTVSCAIGHEVLKVVLEESLQAHALKVGDDLLNKLRQLQARHPIIGDVRGSGLFVGIELVSDRHNLNPGTEQTGRIVNQLRDHGILVGSEGPYHNVIKVRPPMPFTTENVDELIHALHVALPAVSADCSGERA